MPATLPDAWVLAAGPDDPGLAAFPTARAERVLLTGAGLAWLADDAQRARLAGWAADLALCSRSARDGGWSAATAPPGVRWSSVATWTAQLEGRPFGTLLP